MGLFEHGVYVGLCGYQIHWFSIIVPCFEWPLWGYIGMYHFQTQLFATLLSQLGAAWLGVLSGWQPTNSRYAQLKSFGGNTLFSIVS